MTISPNSGFETQAPQPDPLPPKENPEHLALRAQPRPVKRLSRKMLAVGAGSLAVTLLGITAWSLTPKERSAGQQNPELHNVERVSQAEALERLPNNYTQVPPGYLSGLDAQGLGSDPNALPEGVPQLGAPLPGDLAKPMLDAQRAGTYTPTYQGGSSAVAGQYGSSASEVAKSPLFFRDSGGGARGAALGSGATAPAPSASASVLGSALSASTMAQGFNAAGTNADTTAGLADPTAVQNQQVQKQAFVDNPDRRPSGNPSSLQKPISPYQVMAGTLIPAALITGIKSDLPGQVIASTTEPVYDSATGRHVLIPQGSRLIGRYDSQVAFGQRRVLLVWQRVILPDASSILLDRLPGLDTAGFAGLEDGVDWHWDRILAGAALSTLLGVGAELAAPTSSDAAGRVVIATREGLQETINTVGQELTRRNLNVQPTLTIRPGFPVRVMVNQDLVLRPYQPLFFARGQTPQ